MHFNRVRKAAISAVQREARGKMCDRQRLSAIFLARNICAYARRRSAFTAQL